MVTGLVKVGRHARLPMGGEKDEKDRESKQDCVLAVSDVFVSRRLFLKFLHFAAQHDQAVVIKGASQPELQIKKMEVQFLDLKKKKEKKKKKNI